MRSSAANVLDQHTYQTHDLCAELQTRTAMRYSVVQRLLDPMQSALRSSISGILPIVSLNLRVSETPLASSTNTAKQQSCTR